MYFQYEVDRGLAHSDAHPYGMSTERRKGEFWVDAVGLSDHLTEVAIRFEVWDQVAELTPAA